MHLVHVLEPGIPQTNGGFDVSAPFIHPLGVVPDMQRQITGAHVSERYGDAWPHFTAP
ncbi:hypothetical protein ARZXY2_2269 [Arthrobacter sp. ZXY-2]|nr:hypothetical protein ARZXY2_2269 [Arthrobacter sp. ZXY-2]